MTISIKESKYSLTLARPRRINDELLLESLRASFLEVGPGITTRELADRAGVSEGTLFKRFGDKRRMFVQALRLPDFHEEDWYKNLASRKAGVSLLEHLIDAGVMLHNALSLSIPIIQTVFANQFINPQDIRTLLRRNKETPPIQIIETFASLFENEIAAGNLRPLRTLDLARFFVGAVHSDIHLRLYFPQDVEYTSEELVRDVAETLLELAGTRSAPS